MKAAIIFFSGTGNTFRVAEVFKSNLENINYQVDLIDITKHKEKLEGYDLIVAGTPTQNAVSSFNMNAFIAKYLKKKANRNAKFISYVTHSWGVAYGHLTLKDFASRKGYKVIGARAFKVPNNFYMFRKDVPVFDEKMIEESIQNIQQGVWELVNAYLNGEDLIDTRSLLRKNWKAFYAKFNQLTMLSYLAKIMMKVDESKCNGCKLCIKKCSGQNIEWKEGKIQFKNKCLACVRCMHVCPQNAYLLQGEAFEQYKGMKPIMHTEPA